MPDLMTYEEALRRLACDDAAVERANTAMRASAGRYLTDRQIVELVLRAAGEIPS